MAAIDPPLARVVPVRSKKTVFLIAGGVGAFLLLVVILVAVVMHGKSDGEKGGATTTFAPVANDDDLYAAGGNKLAHAPVASVAISIAAAPAASAAPAGLHPTQSRARPSNPVASSPTAVTQGGKQDTFIDDGSGVGELEPLSPDDIHTAYVNNEVPLKGCYERALKTDPNLNVHKLTVRITISAAGIVTDLQMANSGSDLGACVSKVLRGWRFRKSTGEFTTEFDIVFAKRG
jgi:hypothetical protein